jgi:hypothetical protein
MAQRMAMRSDLAGSSEYVQLWLAVIAQALDDALLEIGRSVPSEGGVPGVTYTEDQWTQRRARLWLSNDECGVGSLNWISTVLNLDAGAIRNEYRRRLSARKAEARQDGNSDRLDEDGVSLHERENRAASDAVGSSPNTTSHRWDLLVRPGNRT